jgi:XTP/dITP diphosphohydrolase
VEGDLVLCTANPGKVAELRALMPPGMRVLSLADVGITEELEETGDTLQANAEQKARYVFAKCGIPCIADDTGLEVTALNGAPGVYSARYAGPQRSAADNMRKLLLDLEGVTDRTARFRTVIAYVDARGTTFFEGDVRGTITHEPRGTGGFGYDPLFLPEMSELTFAELDAVRKNAISHRGRAMWRFAEWMHDHRALR